MTEESSLRAGTFSFVRSAGGGASLTVVLDQGAILWLRIEIMVHTFPRSGAARLGEATLGFGEFKVPPGA